MMKDRYSPEEVEAILQNALQRSPMPGAMTRDQLVSLAAEVGVSERDLSLAEQDTLRRPREDALFKAFLADRKCRRVSVARLAGVLSIFFIILNAVTDGSEFWAIFPILGIWLGPAIAWARDASPESLRHSKDYTRWLVRQGIPVVPDIPGADYTRRLR